MRVGFDVAQTCDPKAGCGWATDLLARTLVRTSPEVTFDLYHHFSGYFNDRTSRGTHIGAPNVTEPFRRMRPFQAKRAWRQVEQGKSLPGNPDIVHSNCFRAPVVSPAKLVYTVYDVSFWVRPDFATEVNRLVCQEGVLQAIERARGFVFISQSSRDEFERIFPDLLQQKGIESTVALLASRFDPVMQPRAVPPNSEWLAVGSLEPRKNYQALLDAFELYWQQSRERRSLVIAGGNGWKSKDVRMRISQLEAAKKVRYVGYVSDPELLELYRQSYGLVLLSHYEGFGLPVVEAMSQACPVITRKHTSLPEVGGIAAIYCENDPREIAAAMLRLERNPEYYIQHSARSLRQAAQFSWVAAANQVLELYRKLVSR
jgi:glycosyltransferase involved in cell wall biosynthesis